MARAADVGHAQRLEADQLRLLAQCRLRKPDGSPASSFAFGRRRRQPVLLRHEVGQHRHVLVAQARRPPSRRTSSSPSPGSGSARRSRWRRSRRSACPCARWRCVKRCAFGSPSTRPLHERVVEAAAHAAAAEHGVELLDRQARPCARSPAPPRTAPRSPCAMKLLSSLIVWPAPGPPDVEPRSRQRSAAPVRAARTTASSAPTITFRRPASASTGVRANRCIDQGHAGGLAAIAAGAQSTSGSLVEQSTTTRPGFAPGFTPASRPVSAADHRFDLRRAGDADEARSRIRCRQRGRRRCLPARRAASRSSTRSRLRCPTVSATWCPLA